MSVLFTFPGQGAQRPGMLHALPEHPEVSRTFAETREALGSDPLLLDTSAALQSTIAVQLCLLIASAAMARVLIASDARPDMVAGLSIGAYPAAVTAGALDYSDAVRLVALRARLMETAYPRGYGMAAISGLDRTAVERLIARVHTRSTPVYLANLNAKRQMVVAGSDEALQAIMRLATENSATKAERLAVNVPSHCELFDSAAAELTAAFSRVALRRPRATYLTASSIRAVSDPARIADDLANNMARQVHWSDTARLAWERGARLAVEMPPGGVLTNLTGLAFESGVCVACDGTSVQTVMALVAREHAEG